MPWSVAASVGGALLSSALAPDSTAGGAGGNTYTPTGLSGADAGWQQLQDQNVGLVSAGNPYSPGYQTSANTAGQNYGALAGQAQTSAGQFGQQAQQAYGAENTLQQAGQNVYNLATDPQSALFNRTQQQLTDQVNVGQAQRGLGTSAVGGSEYNQAMSNFDIDWQNNQLSRANTGLSALTGAYNQANQSAALGNADLAGQLLTGAQGAGYQLQSGQTPYNAANNMSTNQLSQTSGVQSQAIPYMNYGQGAAQQNYTNQANVAGAAGALTNQGISALGGSGLGSTLSGMFSGGNTGTSSDSGYGTGFGSGLSYSTFGNTSQW